jgi:hypothetical protein
MKLQSPNLFKKLLHLFLSMTIFLLIILLFNKILITPQNSRLNQMLTFYIMYIYIIIDYYNIIIIIIIYYYRFWSRFPE